MHTLRIVTVPMMHVVEYRRETECELMDCVEEFVSGVGDCVYIESANYYNDAGDVECWKSYIRRLRTQLSSIRDNRDYVSYLLRDDR